MSNSTRWQILWFRMNTQLFCGLASSETTHEVKVLMALKPAHFAEVKGSIDLSDIGTYYACRPEQVPAIIRARVRAYLFDNEQICTCKQCLQTGLFEDSAKLRFLK